MRDIREDLHERLADLDTRYADEMRSYDEKRSVLDAEHGRVIAEITRERDALSVMVAVEDRKAGTPAPIDIKPRALVPLSDFLITKAAAYGAVSKDELKAEAEAAGYPEAKSGRQFHFVLMNVTKAHKLHRLPDGRYAHPNPSPALSGLFAQRETEEGKMRTVM